MYGVPATLPGNYLINCRGRLLDLSTPRVMGIINVTDDSFYRASRSTKLAEALQRAEAMVQQGAALLDVGGQSTRPGAQPVSEEEELKRVLPVLEALCTRFPDVIVSVDTYRARVAAQAIAAGAALINDISAGRLDEALLPLVARLKVPYVLMHMQGTPQTMQQHPTYGNVVEEVFRFFSDRLATLYSLGIYDVIIDPGFGFGKTLRHNYTLLKHLKTFSTLGCPLLVGISRKSMVYKPLGLNADVALNGTTALHVLALQGGARLLRVHDVAEAMQVIRLQEEFQNAGQEGA